MATGGKKMYPWKWTPNAAQRKLFESWKDDVVNYLMICKEGVGVRSFRGAIKEYLEDELPLEKMGFRSANQFLYEMQDKIEVRTFEGNLFIFIRPSAVPESGRHVRELVLGQNGDKTCKSRSGATRRPKKSKTSFVRPVELLKAISQYPTDDASLVQADVCEEPPERVANAPRFTGRKASYSSGPSRFTRRYIPGLVDDDDFDNSNSDDSLDYYGGPTLDQLSKKKFDEVTEKPTSAIASGSQAGAVVPESKSTTSVITTASNGMAPESASKSQPYSPTPNKIDRCSKIAKPFSHVPSTLITNLEHKFKQVCDGDDEGLAEGAKTDPKQMSATSTDSWDTGAWPSEESIDGSENKETQTKPDTTWSSNESLHTAVGPVSPATTASSVSKIRTSTPFQGMSTVAMRNSIVGLSASFDSDEFFDAQELFGKLPHPVIIKFPKFLRASDPKDLYSYILKYHINRD